MSTKPNGQNRKQSHHRDICKQTNFNKSALKPSRSHDPADTSERRSEVAETFPIMISKCGAAELGEGKLIVEFITRSLEQRFGIVVLSEQTSSYDPGMRFKYLHRRDLCC